MLTVESAYARLPETREEANGYIRVLFADDGGRHWGYTQLNTFIRKWS